VDQPQLGGESASTATGSMHCTPRRRRLALLDMLPGGRALAGKEAGPRGVMSLQT
jgi:hypothetical protein